MAWFKKKITEQEAARLVMEWDIDLAEQVCPGLIKGLQGLDGRLGDNLNISADAKFELFQILSSLHVQSLANLFPADQAVRLYGWVDWWIRHGPPDLGERLRNTMAEFTSRWQSSLDLMLEAARRGKPLRWLSPDDHSLLLSWWGLQYDPVDMGGKTIWVSQHPLHEMTLNVCISNLPNPWKRIQQDYKLVPTEE